MQRKEAARSQMHATEGTRATVDASDASATPCGSQVGSDGECRMGWSCPDAVCACSGGELVDPSCSCANFGGLRTQVASDPDEGERLGLGYGADDGADGGDDDQ